MLLAARSSAELAATLPPDDPERGALAARAAATYREAGLEARAARAEALAEPAAAAAPATGTAAAAAAADGTFRREGEYWTVGLGGDVARIKDSKGMRDIAQLLAHAGREVHVSDLAAATEGSAPARTGGGAPEGVEGDLGPALDDAARAAYRARLEDLQEQIDDAEALGDSARTSLAREEMERIASELASAYGLGGRARRTGDPVEKARKAVAGRIREAIGKIERAHSALGRHLARSIRTGTFCSYSPEHPTTWAL